MLQWPDQVQRFQSSERRYKDTHQGGNLLFKGTETQSNIKSHQDITTRKHKDKKETLLRHGTKTEKQIKTHRPRREMVVCDQIRLKHSTTWEVTNAYIAMFIQV